VTAPAWLWNMVRTLVVAVWAMLIARVPPVAALLELLTPDQVSVVQAAIATFLAGLLIGLIAGAVHWLSTRQGNGLPARAARWLAALIMLGLNAKQPVYADTRDPNLKPIGVVTERLNWRGTPTGDVVDVPAAKP
jgi:hypothetical protein